MKNFYILILLALTAIQASAQMHSKTIRERNPNIFSTRFKPSGEDSQKDCMFSNSPVSGWLLDSTYYSNWNTGSTAWDLYEKNFQTYNSTGQILQSLYVEFDGILQEWINSYQYLYVYYPSGNYEMYNTQTWDNTLSSWMIVGHYHYNTSGFADTSFSKTYDNINHRYSYGAQSIYSYNASWQNTEILNQVLDTATSHWVNSSRYQYTFDASNHTTEMLYQNWNTGNWVNSTKTDYTYDGSGFATGYTKYTWDNGGSAWVNFVLANYTINASGIPLVKLYKSWDAGTSSWVNIEQESYQYNTGNQVTQYLDQQWDAVNLQWNNYGKDTYTYYTSGLQHEITNYYWNPLALSYMDVYYAAYDSLGYQVDYYSKSIDWNTYVYTSGYKYVYSYTPLHTMDHTLEQMLDPIMLAWYDYSKRQDTYDANLNLILELDQNYDTLTHAWTNAFKQDHFYTHTSGIREKHGMSEYCYFANPLESGKSIVCPNLAAGKNYLVNLDNLQGQAVFTRNIHTGESFSIPGNLATGMYMMQIIENGKMVAAGKVIVK